MVHLVHRTDFRIIPALSREWRMVSSIPLKVIPVIAVASVIEQLATTKFSDMGSLIHKTMPHRVIRDPVGRLFYLGGDYG